MADRDTPLDPFVRNVAFPDPREVFGFAPVSLGDALAAGLVVLDTNVLLVPYNAGPASVGQIKATYSKLAAEKRLKVPGQVAREFAFHRAEKLKALHQQLSRKRSLSISLSQYPLLEGSVDYGALLEIERQLDGKVKEYRNAISTVLRHVREWRWNDPVSAIYRELFGDDVVTDPAIDQTKTKEDLQYRHANKLPPGYKDAGNDSSGVGDLLIWKTILDLGGEFKKHLVFVSGDEKTD
jgi:hypothetical protein